MKIGAFAKRFNINTSAVRFYINNGLLGPNRTNSQYEFGKECVSDMENILKYKRYQFSLEEIQLLFFMEKTARFHDEIVLEVCANILKNKKTALLLERENLTAFISELEQEINHLPISPLQDMPTSGVPFAYIPYLYCPKCQIPLKLDSASLADGSIQKGLLWCECGYKATISEGVILCQDFTEETPFKAFDNVDSVISMKNEFSSDYRMLIKKTYIWMYNQIESQKNEAKHILAGPFTLNFLLEYIDKLGKDNIYIIFDPSNKRISKIKNYLSAWNYSIVYIVGKPNALPIKQRTINIYIDDYSTVNSLFTYNTFSTEFISPLIKNHGEVIGIFTAYQHAQKSLLNFKQNHPAFFADKMTLSNLKYHWSQKGIQYIAEKVIGTTTAGEKHYPQDEIGEFVEVQGYHAKKVNRTDC